MSQFLTGIRRTQSLLDASMILFDPSAILLILSELEKELKALLKDMSLPKISERVRDFILYFIAKFFGWIGGQFSCCCKSEQLFW